MKILSRLPPAMRLAISITLLVLSIVSVAMAIGLLPDRLTVQLQERARMAEALTIQLASFAAEGELAAMQRSLAGIEQRDPEILSIAIRDPGSGMVVETTGHQEFWKDARPDRSTSTHVRVPIVSGEKDWGTVEIVFAPLQGGIPLLGLPSDLLRFAGFLAAGCLFGVFTVLHMALRQLDPSRSVPTRVQNAFDSLSDGIAIVDEADTILLVNQQLAAILGGEPKEYLGKALSKLMWRHWSQDGAGDAFPWTLALKHGDGVRDVPMNLRSNSGGLVNVLVNASCIPSDSGRVAGALVTFKDVTVLERKNMDLSLAYTRLKESEHEIKRQNNQLRYLASHDPLTSCLNRRSMSEAFAQKLEAARQNGRALTCLMVDIDHFKKINDTYGHSTGDDVIAGMGKLLRDNCGSDDLVGRYGGEEFCVALDGIDIEGATVLAERLRQETRQRGPDWLKRDGVVTVSIGIAAVDTETVGEAVDHADQALYVAKRTGRDRAVRWHRGLSDSTAPAAAASEPHAASAVAAAALPLPAAPAALASLTANRQRSMLELDSLLGRVSDSISRARRDSKAVAVICVSIDSLEEFADAFGPQAAGELANAIEGRLSAIFRDSDTVALMSGNERPVALGNVRGSRFLIEVSGIDDNTSIVWILQRLAQRMETPFGPASHDIPVRFSIGASLYPQDGKDANEVVQNAILAQKRALDAGGDRAYRMFSSDMFEMVREQLLVEKGIREAIANNEFHIRFQPIVNLVESKVSGAEVLLRSSNSTLQNTPIGLVIQVAERTGLIHAISHCVFSSAFSTLREWRRNGIELPLISINLSAKQLQDKAIIMTLIELVEQNGIEPASIQLEMTETAMVKDMAETSRILQALQSYGFHIALDDFGTGGSSLSHLIDIKPDAIKIDRSFIQALSRKHTNDILVSMITELSQRIGAKVIAEGVETTDQLEALIGIGCHYVQGYLFSRPLPAEAFRDWLIMASREEERPAPSRESRPRIADRTGSAGVMRRAG